MKKYLIQFIQPLVALLLFASCLQTDEHIMSAENSISGLKCFVYYDSNDLTKKQEIDLLSVVNQATGNGTYTFPSDPMYTSATLTRCRLEVTIPTTATLVETDYDGNKISSSIGGQRSLYKTTVAFKVRAATGQEKLYRIQFRVL